MNKKRYKLKIVILSMKIIKLFLQLLANLIDL